MLKEQSESTEKPRIANEDIQSLNLNLTPERYEYEIEREREKIVTRL